MMHVKDKPPNLMYVKFSRYTVVFQVVSRQYEHSNRDFTKYMKILYIVHNDAIFSKHIKCFP